MKNIVFLILAIFIFTSCEELFTTVRDLDIPEHEPKLAINMELSGDSLYIFIDHSKAIDDESPNDPINSNISLLEDGKELINFNYSNLGGNSINILQKKLDNKIQNNKEYTLVVDSEKFGVAKSTETSPTPSPIENIVFDTTSYKGEYEEYNKFSFTIDDQKGIDNYYIFKFKKIQNGKINRYIYSKSNDPELTYVYLNTTLSKKHGYYNGSTHLMSDKNFDGTKRKVTIELSKGYYGPQNHKSYKLIFTAISITKSYYNFLLSYQQAKGTDDNPFAEPVAISGNIENGYGIFNVFNAKSYIIEVE